MIAVADDWRDFELIDAGDGEKLERWGPYVLRRPDPQAIWPPVTGDPRWNDPDGHYHRSSSGGGKWEFRRPLPERWQIGYGGLRFYIRPTGFKHTGLFPEQAANWRWIMDRIAGAGRPVRVLNLFAYTGGATLAAAAAGAEVCHVDAAKGMVQWARDNAALSGLSNAPIRWITDDVFKFVRREERRGRRYDAIIMDPPAYGRGPEGEMWKLEQHLGPFLELCARVLSDKPLFVLVNTYTAGLSPTALANLLHLSFWRHWGGDCECGEIGLPVGRTGLILPCGVSGRWTCGG